MNLITITEAEIAQRQADLRETASRARNDFTFGGMRGLIGNTIIAIGTLVHGPERKERPAMPEVAPAHGL